MGSQSDLDAVELLECVNRLTRELAEARAETISAKQSTDRFAQELVSLAEQWRLQIRVPGVVNFVEAARCEARAEMLELIAASLPPLTAIKEGCLFKG